MNDEQMVFRLRKRIFQEWRHNHLTWQEVKHNYGFSKAWFYKFRQRYIKYGDQGLKNKKRDNSFRPHALTWQQKLQILDYVYDNPTHGPNRIASALHRTISGKTVWSYLKQENLNTKRKRRLWAESQGKPVLTEKEKAYLWSKKKHIESKAPGELVSVDTLEIRVKGLGKIWQWTACDTFSSYGWAKVYNHKTSDQTIDFLECHILKNVPENKIKRILTDQGTEFYSARHKISVYSLEKLCHKYNFKHSVTKRGHPWTNGYAERLNRTIWEEFYLCRLSLPFSSLEDLQKQLDQFMNYYNFSRLHSGYKLQEQGIKYPAHAFFDLKENSQLVKMKATLLEENLYLW